MLQVAHLYAVLDRLFVDVPFHLICQLLPEPALDLIHVGDIAPSLRAQRKVLAAARHQLCSLLPKQVC